MKKLIILFVIIYSLFVHCKGSSANKYLSNLNQLDTTLLLPKAREYIHQYIESNPQYENYTLISDADFPKTYGNYLRFYYMIGPSTPVLFEHARKEMMYPASYVRISKKIVFIQSNVDKIYSSGKFRLTYLACANSAITAEEFSEHCWVIQVLENDQVIVASKKLPESFNFWDTMVKKDIIKKRKN